FSNNVNLKALNDGRILFVDSRNYSGQNPSSLGQLFVANTNGSIQQLGNAGFTSFSNLRSFTLSADETSLYFINNQNLTNESVNNSYQAFRWDLSTGSISKLSNFHYTQNDAPDSGVFSGDGRILYGNESGYITGNYGYRLCDLSATASSIAIAAGSDGSALI